MDHHHSLQTERGLPDVSTHLQGYQQAVAEVQAMELGLTVAWLFVVRAVMRGRGEGRGGEVGVNENRVDEMVEECAWGGGEGS